MAELTTKRRGPMCPKKSIYGTFRVSNDQMNSACNVRGTRRRGEAAGGGLPSAHVPYRRVVSSSLNWACHHLESHPIAVWHRGPPSLSDGQHSFAVLKPICVSARELIAPGICRVWGL
jgi:hypothetical protein